MASHSADTRFSDLESLPLHVNKPSIVPVGLNFGPTSLSIVFFANDSEYYTGVPCGACDELYTRFFQDTLSKGVQCNLESSLSDISSTPADPSLTDHAKISELVETFSKHIKSAINMGISALDYNPALKFKLMAVTVPDHWGESARTLVATATKVAGHPLDGSHMIISLSRAIQLTFQMSKYTGWSFLTLLLDYNKSYLHLMLVEICGAGCTMKRQVYFPHLGEDELHKASVVGSVVASELDNATHNVAQSEPSDVSQNDNSSQSTNASSGSDLMFPIGDVHTKWPIQQPVTIGSRTSHESSANRTPVPDGHTGQRPVCHNKAAHFKPIIDTVSKFMIQTRATENQNAAEKPVMPEHAPSDLRDAVRNVRYIVIDGEASIPGLWDLRDAIKHTFINEEWINIEGNKRDCGAYGAALAASRQLQNPKHVGDWKDLPGYVPGKAR